MNRNGFISAVLSLFIVAPAIACAQATTPTRQFTTEDQQEVRNVFLRQAHAATAHDLAEFDSVLAAAPPDAADPVTFVARAYRFWGKAAVLDHFRETFKGVWKFEPEVDNIKIIPIDADVAQIYAPTMITLGESAASAKTARFLMYEVALRTGAGWRITSIVAVPAT
ncbi:MAG TPA: nuclear transport factor 2 family protein [Paraburkholderia sp.]|jgi:hypothetical protein|nr:nuclear transport factor 2 family protein [Paraburkholderia sp.]